MSDAADIAQVVLVTLGAAKVLEAPAAAVGELLKERIKRRLDRTLEKARDKGMGEPISDRVAFKVLNEAAFTDDDLILEYLAGVMAASGSEDDTGAAVVAQIGRLSATQLRLHYLVYREIRRLWPSGLSLNIYLAAEREQATLRIPVQDLEAALGPAVPPHVGNLVGALAREALISDYQFSEEPGEGWVLRVRPSAPGAELFLWGHGASVRKGTALVDRHVALAGEADVPPTPGVTFLNPPAPPQD